ncbi:GAK system CofD-like protein [Maridesulfovibrio sp.]|uniref:GAK system CofD-like protein n=1 Tax=Maridesulfovibrio sp. TaxID=2795000 RepID=UPI0029F48CFD|nr:GAK system CofD-like protein [Maridesulfovibrio sp.]
MEKTHPSIVFFSGGSALNGLASELAKVNPLCAYIITTFDSGGSSAALREVLNMPAVGDVRNRMLALADIDSHEKANIVAMLNTRLPLYADRTALYGQLAHLANGSHSLMDGFSEIVRKIISERFALFIELVGDSFNPVNASLGNIVLAAGFIANQRILAPSIAQLSRLIGVRGIVRASTVDNGHLAVRLMNGEILAGQHHFTGKESDPVSSPIEGMWICSGIDDPWPRSVHASSLAINLVNSADLIVYPMGSFYSSTLAALSPQGLGKAVAAKKCPKIFIPNMGFDPELLGHDINLQVERILDVLRMDSAAYINFDRTLNYILIDSENGTYQENQDFSALEKLPVKVIDRRLVSDESGGLIDPRLLAPVLMELAETGGLQN